MTHDPLCPHDKGAYHELGENSCVCDFIDKVRADTLDKAAQRVEAIHQDSRIRSISRVLAAIREEQP